MKLLFCEIEGQVFMLDTPLLTLGIIAYNEENYIKRLFSDIINQTYPKNKIDLILVDSQSTDRTVELFHEFAEQYGSEFYSVRIFKSPGKIVPFGLNVVLKNALGDVFLRIDAHAAVPSNFIENSIACLMDGHDACGGLRPCIVENETPYHHTLLMAEESMFGSSIAAYRHSEEACYTKSLFHGVYRMEIFKKVGLYNEKLARTEDNEMSYRIRKAGYKLYYNPELISYQYMRSDLLKMIRQKFGNGKWIGITTGICPQCLRPYHFVPFLFVMAILLTAVLAAFSINFPITLLWSVYGLFAVLMSIFAIVGSPKRHLVNGILPFLFLLLHVSYGVGTICGFFEILFRRKKYKS